MNRNRFALFLTIFLMLSLPHTMTLEPVEEHSNTGSKSIACSNMHTVCINEVFVNAVGAETDAVGPSDWTSGEWVEIHNSATSSIDITGWYLEDHYSTPRVLTPSTTSTPQTVVWPQNPSNLVIPAGGYMVIARNGDGQSCGFCMTNGQGEVNLYDSSSTLVHQVTWTSYVSQGNSLVEGSSPTQNWVEVTTITPGAANTGGGTGSGPSWNISDLAIVEILPDSWPTADNSSYPGGEWVEIENQGSATIDLTNWSVKDLAGNVLQLNETHLIGHGETTSIAPGERRIVATNGSHMLNNGEDSAILVNPQGEYVSAANYSNHDHAGQSYISPGIGNGNWVRSLFPTPGETNAVNINGSSPVRINEVMINATNSWLDYPNGEWIEISHRGENPSVDIAGWHLITGTGQTIPLITDRLVDRDSGTGTVIEAGSYVVIGVPQYLAMLRIFGDNLNLINESGAVVDSVFWASDPGTNVTAIPVDPDLPSQPLQISGWATPAAANPNQVSGSIDVDANFRITELMPDPPGSDSNLYPEGDWVEITNVGNTTASFQGWTIRDGRGSGMPLDDRSIPSMNESIPEDWEVEPGESVVVYRDGRSFDLKHYGDVITLEDDSGAIVQTLTYDSLVVTRNGTLLPNTDATGYWINSPHPTPGMANDSFENPYTGSVDLVISEVMPQCDSDSWGIGGDWIELHNTGTESINLSRWILSNDGENQFREALSIRPEYLLYFDEEVITETQNKLILEAGNHVIVRPETNGLMSNYNEKISLFDPNLNLRQEVTWVESEDCDSLEGDASAWSEPWWGTIWPTPGAENPIPQPWDPEDPVWFTRIMPGQVHGRDNEFIEITNMADSILNLAGWRLQRVKSDGSADYGTFDSLQLNPGKSLVLSHSPENLIEDGGIDSILMEDVLDYSPWMYDSGSSMQLITPDGTVADTVVYGSGSANVTGWSGPAISTPPTSFQGLIFLRGDGCNEMEDSNTSADWEVRWLRLGASLFCDSGVFSTTGDLTPMISPEGALYSFLEWLDDTDESIHIHVYELMHPDIIAKLIALSLADVDVTVVLEEDPLEDTNDLYNIRGYAFDLYAAGVEVYWMGTPRGDAAPPAPYQYIHSKVAVQDGNSVWIGSGNLKSSTMPVGEYSGNRDWSLVINSEDVAQLIMSRLSWDENESHKHLLQYSVMDPQTGKPTGWTGSGPTGIDAVPPAESPPTISGEFTGEVLTCPDDCVSGIVSLLDNAESSIDLSLQGFDMGWHWGYGENPLMDAIERALARGVSVRLLMNGYYVYQDDDIRETVNHFNNQWNRTDGYDATAILMAPSDDVVKLHNKGVIVDGKSVLVSSINWNSNAILRNREMGIVIHNETLSQYFEASFEEDWYRMDTNTDTDGDNLPDYWEMENGLNRTSSKVPESSLPEQSHDFDNDGLNNFREFNFSSDPLDPDTDDDCIEDGMEVAFAALKGISASDAIQQTDADQDGVADGEQTNCGADLAIPDDDGGDDQSNDDQAPQIPEADNPLDSTAAKVMIGLILLAALALAAALAAMIYGGREDALGVITDETLDSFEPLPSETSEPTMEQPNIDSSDSTDPPPSDDPKILSTRDNTIGRDDGAFGAPLLDAGALPGWDPEEIQGLIAQGWTMEQLKEEYDRRNE